MSKYFVRPLRIKCKLLHQIRTQTDPNKPSQSNSPAILVTHCYFANPQKNSVCSPAMSQPETATKRPVRHTTDTRSRGGGLCPSAVGNWPHPPFVLERTVVFCILWTHNREAPKSGWVWRRAWSGLQLPTHKNTAWHKGSFFGSSIQTHPQTNAAKHLMFWIQYVFSCFLYNKSSSRSRYI